MSEENENVKIDYYHLTTYSSWCLFYKFLIELVDHIKIYEGGDISIKFKFADEYRRVAEYIEANKQKAAV